MKSNAKNKICIISTIRNPHVIRWARILISKGYDITVVSSESNEWEINDITVIECISGASHYKVLRLIKEFTRTIRICRILKKLNPDVVHIHSLDYIHPFFVGFVDLLTNCFQVLIVSPWGTDVISTLKPSSSFMGILSKKILFARAQVITATTKYLADITTKLVPKGTPIHIIPFGVDFKIFHIRKESLSRKAVHIGFVKHLTPKYGPDYLLKAMAIVAKRIPNVHLSMVGHGGMEDHLKQMVAELDIERLVTFTGYRQYEEIPNILSDFDIFVMPTTESESFGVAAIEAQAMEVPVIASDIGGIPEAILDGETGILVEPKNVEALSEAIIKLILNNKLRKKMAKRGRKFVFKNYNIEDNVLMFENLYNRAS